MVLTLVDFCFRPNEAVNFLDWPFLGVTAPFVVPALAGILALQSGSIPPKGGTTNTLYKNSQPQRAPWGSGSGQT